ncbi:serine/threonine-protein kinase [Antrihabitans sp. YC2-6]|uniref:serine/threonine-protein kinase n=1 Tax=Antrihabitans sp. YC2-6 TaxID=2799498 RepID=UPI0018F69BE0|nr:serine/threonine-protein kinase [Antrihabitans sp. YC2-6]MBJ8345613.1 protein kinase [Antrihabitans sp. YC2-6]
MVAGRLVAGRYRLTDRIGSGGMGVVWLAHDNRLDRMVAVKQLLLTPGLSAAAAEEANHRALREGRIAARLHHPHAIAVYDVAEEDGMPWLIMEYLQSRSLADMLEETGPIGHIETAAIGAQVASALAASHEAGIVHRDVKPANILIGDNGSVKITDFGISRATGDVTVTATGMVAGTPAYLAPEVARGDYPESPADVFALGAVLYMMIEGNPPFGNRDNTLALLHAVAAGEIEQPRSTGPLTRLLLDMLAKDPERRPTMRQAQDVLERVAATQDNTGQARTALIAAPAQERAKPEPTRREAPPQRVQQASPSRQQPRTTVEPALAPQQRHAPVPPQRLAPRQAPQQLEKPRRGIGLAVAVLLLAGLVAVGVVVAMIVNNRDNTSGGSNTTSQIDPSNGGSSSDVNFDTMSEFVRDYYSLLPDDTDAAYAKLAANYQGKNPRSSYDSFWGGIKSVTVDSVTEGTSGTSSVNVALTYVDKNGKSTSENRWVAVIDEGSGLVLYDSETF